MRDFDGAIFDLDGTLLDSMGVWEQIDIDSLGKRGFDVPDDYRTDIAPMSPREIAEYTIRRFHLQDTPEELMKEWLDMAYEAYSEHLPLKPYALEYVRCLHSRGVHMAVATSSYRELTEAALSRTGILPMLDCVVTSQDVKRGKGFPDIYLKAAEIMKVKPADCAVFEDIIEGVRAAKTGGFLSVGVYEPENHSPADAIRKEADVFITSFAELLPDKENCPGRSGK